MANISKIHVLPNIITAFGLTCGLFVIFKMCMTPSQEVNSHVLTIVAGFLLLAAIADLLDGAVARAIKAESDFGGLFDSLADAITFGVAPAVIVLKTLASLHGTPDIFLMLAAAMVYSVCGVLRLVRFNVMAARDKLDPILEDAGKKNFTGLPIPAAAVAAVSANLLLMSDDTKYYFDFSSRVDFWIMFGVLITLGYFMISRWKFPSFKTLHVRVSSFQVVFFTVVTAVVVFYGILNHFAAIFFLISWAYLIIAWILSIARMITGKKSKTLEDFEPEPDDSEEIEN